MAEVLFSIKVKLKIKEDINNDLDINESFNNGDVGFEIVEASMISEDGTDLLDNGDNHEALKSYIVGFIGGAH